MPADESPAAPILAHDRRSAFPGYFAGSQQFPSYRRAIRHTAGDSSRLDHARRAGLVPRPAAHGRTATQRAQLSDSTVSCLLPSLPPWTLRVRVGDVASGFVQILVAAAAGDHDKGTRNRRTVAATRATPASTRRPGNAVSSQYYVRASTRALPPRAGSPPCQHRTPPTQPDHDQRDPSRKSAVVERLCGNCRTRRKDPARLRGAETARWQRVGCRRMRFARDHCAWMASNRWLAAFAGGGRSRRGREVAAMSRVDALTYATVKPSDQETSSTSTTKGASWCCRYDSHDRE